MNVRFIAYLSAHAPEEFVTMFGKPISNESGHYLSCTTLAASSVPGWVRLSVLEPQIHEQQEVHLHVPQQWLAWIAEQEQPFPGLTPEG